jgi:FO synthase subunit 2
MRYGGSITAFFLRKIFAFPLQYLQGEAPSMQPALPPGTNHPVEPKPKEPRVILDTVEDGRELSAGDALQLLRIQKEDDMALLREAADATRKRQRGDAIGTNAGCSLFLTSLDEMAPAIYSYPRRPGDTGAWTLSIDEIDACLELAGYRNLTQITVSSGGFWPYLQIPGLEAPTLLKTYAKVLAHIREKAPTLTITGFSPDEVDFLRIISDRSERYVLELLKDQGLQVLDGHGAEILVDAVRRKVSPKKAKVKRWLEIVATAHSLAVPTVLKIEAGHFETLQQRVQHLERAREFLKKQPGAFSMLVPQMWTGKAPEEARNEGRNSMPGAACRTHQDQLRLIAVSRLFLGELLPTQQVFWQPDGAEQAKEGLQWGADFLGSTDSLSYHAFLAGSRERVDFTPDELARLSRR